MSALYTTANMFIEFIPPKGIEVKLDLDTIPIGGGCCNICSKPLFRDSRGWSLVYYIDEQRYLRARHICCGDVPIWELTKTKIKPLHWYNKIGT